MEKVVNYTAEQTAELVEAYVSAANDGERKNVVTNFALEFGKSEGSVRAKLVSEKVYVAAKRETKRVAKKAELVTNLAKSLNLDEDVVGSLEKATAVALTKVLESVARIKKEAKAS